MRICPKQALTANKTRNQDVKTLAMKKILLTLLFCAAMTNVSVPKAGAMDPVTIAVLAPYALPYAEMAGKYALKGFMNMAKGFGDIAIDIFDIFRLPLGLFQVLFGLPFGLLFDGFYNLGQGALAPFKLAFDALMLPVRFVGLGPP